MEPVEIEGRARRRAGTGSRKVTTARDDRHLVRMAVTDRRTSSTVLSDYIDVGVLQRVWTCLLQQFVHCPETTNASDCNGHVDAITGVLSGDM